MDACTVHIARAHTARGPLEDHARGRWQDPAPRFVPDVRVTGRAACALIARRPRRTASPARRASPRETRQSRWRFEGTDFCTSAGFAHRNANPIRRAFVSGQPCHSLFITLPSTTGDNRLEDASDLRRGEMTVNTLRGIVSFGAVVLVAALIDVWLRVTRLA